eukprot:3430597-Prymnesium_polylepis.1
MDHQGKPFYAASVGSYHINSVDTSANREMWSTTDKSGAYRIFNSSFDNMIHAEDWTSSYFEIGWLEERRTRRHTYQ